MVEIKEKQQLKYGFGDVIPGLEWVETYDGLQRHWPYSKSKGQKDRGDPPIREAARRMVRRRNYQPVPSWLSFKSTVDYYEAVLPLMMGCGHLNHPASSWRYMRPMMVRMLMARWFRRTF